MSEDRIVAALRDAYRRDRMATYGPCPYCGGPRTTAWNVTGTPEDHVIEMGLRCLDCGDGDPTYRQETTS